MIFTLNRKPMRPNELGTFVVRRPGILGLNDSLKKGAKCIRLPSLPPSSSFPLISKKPQQVLEKRSLERRTSCSLQGWHVVRDVDAYEPTQASRLAPSWTKEIKEFDSFFFFGGGGGWTYWFDQYLIIRLSIAQRDAGKGPKDTAEWPEDL
jgi:hypothetical protein